MKDNLIAHINKFVKLNESEEDEICASVSLIYALNAWRETHFFTPEERAILALTEEITNIKHGVSEKTFEEAAQVLDRPYIAKVIMAAVTINAWNRIGIGTGLQPTA